MVTCSASVQLMSIEHDAYAVRVSKVIIALIQSRDLLCDGLYGRFSGVAGLSGSCELLHPRSEPFVNFIRVSHRSSVLRSVKTGHATHFISNSTVMPWKIVDAVCRRASKISLGVLLYSAVPKSMRTHRPRTCAVIWGQIREAWRQSVGVPVTFDILCSHLSRKDHSKA